MFQRDKYIKGLQVPPGPPTQHGIYASPEWTGEPYPSIDWSDISQDQEPPEGWPRPPKFNEPGDVPGPPVQYGEAITNANVKAGFNFIPNGVEEKNLYFYHPDHLGSSSYITDREGRITQHTEYIAFGETFVDEHSVNPRQPYLFNGKELDMETGLYYYGARYYDPKVSLWLNTDPLAEKYPEVSPYTYTLNNPIMLVDPDGRDIIGVTKKDAQNFQQDIYRVLSDKKFESVRALISIKGNKFNKIDGLALTKALENISVSTDEKTYIDIVVNTINSKEVHKVEYLSGDFTSSEGASAFRDHMNNAQQGIGDMLLTPDGNLSSTFIDSQGGGLNVPTKKGAHSFISAMHKDDDRAIISGHELFGHGIPSAKKTDDKTNNSNAIRTDNLIRRLLGKPERDGSNHAGYKQGHITEPNQLPMTE